MSLQPPSPAWITFSEWELAIFKGILFHLRSVSHLDVSKSYSLLQINGSNLCRSLPFIKWKTKNPSQMPQRCLRERKRLMCQLGTSGSDTLLPTTSHSLPFISVLGMFLSTLSEGKFVRVRGPHHPVNLYELRSTKSPQTLYTCCAKPERSHPVHGHPAKDSPLVLC